MDQGLIFQTLFLFGALLPFPCLFIFRLYLGCLLDLSLSPPRPLPPPPPPFLRYYLELQSIAHVEKNDLSSNKRPEQIAESIIGVATS